MGVNDIIQVSAQTEGENIVYTVIAAAPCTGTVQIILSNRREINPESRLEAQFHWDDFSGIVFGKKSVLEAQSDLFLYLLDADTGVTSNIVTIYGRAPELRKWAVDEAGSLVLLLDRTDNGYRSSSKCILYGQDGQGHVNYDLELPGVRVPLERLGMWLDTQALACTLVYYRKSEKADIFSIPSQQFPIYLAPPEVRSIHYDGEAFAVTGNFLPDAPLCAALWAGEQCLKSGNMTGGVFPVSGTELDPQEDCTISLRYGTDRGESLESTRIPVVVTAPQVEECVFAGEDAILRLREWGTCEVTIGETSEQQTGREIRVPMAAQSVSLCRVWGISSGPAATVSVAAPAFYPAKVGEAVFYAPQQRPDTLKTNQDITLVLPESAKGADSYQGTLFQVAVEGETATLTMKKEIYTTKPCNAQADYTAMCGHYAGGTLWEPLRRAVRRSLPVRPEELLFYHCDCSMADGYTEICEGMSLLVEYAIYQNIPGESLDGEESTLTDLSGFAGTGTARYQVVRRDGRLTIDSFAAGVNCMVPAPQEIGSDGKLCGGAGVADLVYEGFSAKYMRLVYPMRFAERNSAGRLVYGDNICLLTADRPDDLLKATENLRRKALAVPGVAYNYFRGRAVVTPQICVTVNGQAQWVSLGTTLGDLIAQWGGTCARLKRRWEGALLPVESPTEDMPLLIGDCIEV